MEKVSKAFKHYTCLTPRNAWLPHEWQYKPTRLHLDNQLWSKTQGYPLEQLFFSSNVDASDQV
jgi:hypothetical protein